jgi:nicotinate-nucleotide adenylyltransferase
VSETLAVFGGSFNPPHVAHTLVAAYVLASQACDRVVVVPTAQHAFGKGLADFSHRVRMCELAMANLRGVEVSSIEDTLPAPNRTLHTLEALGRIHVGAKLRLVIGSDLLAETHAWHNFARIEELAPPIVIERQGYARAGVDTPALPAISSTEVRRRLSTGQSTEGLLTPAVARYAIDHALYAGTATPS